MKAKVARGRRRAGSARFRVQQAGRATPGGRVEVWRVTGYHGDGTRIRKIFTTRAEAAEEASLLEIGAANEEALHQPRPTRLSDSQLREAEWCLGALEGKATLREAVSWYVANYRPPVMSKPIVEAYEEFVATKKRENLRTDSLQSYRTPIMRLVGEKADGATVADVLKADVERVVNWGTNSPTARNNDRRELHTFLGWCTKRGYAATNVASEIARARVDATEPVILTMAEVKALLRAAQEQHDGALVPYVTLGVFCGLRPTELARIGWDHIDLAQGIVRVTGDVAKMRGRRVVTISDNAVDWLADHAARRTPIRPKNFRRMFDAVKMAAGWGTEKTTQRQGGSKALTLRSWVPDAMRHTAISMHYAEHEHEGKTASWAGNSPVVVHRHYKGLVTKAQATEFWHITPGNVSGEIIPLPATATA